MARRKPTYKLPKTPTPPKPASTVQQPAGTTPGSTVQQPSSTTPSDVLSAGIPKKYVIPPAPATSTVSKSNPIAQWIAHYPNPWKNTPGMAIALRQFSQTWAAYAPFVGAVYQLSQGKVDKAWLGKMSPDGTPITEKWLSSPGNVINLIAWAMAGNASSLGIPGIDETGNLATWYQSFNPSFKGTPQQGPGKYLKWLTANQIASASGLRSTPINLGVEKQAQTSQAQLQNPAERVAQLRATYDSIFLAYTGHIMTEGDIKQLIKVPITTYQLELNLSNTTTNPSFLQSPIWKTHSATYESYYQDIFGPTAKAPEKVIAWGVIHNLDQSGFEAEIRLNKIPGAPSYETSENYKQQYAQLQQAYAQIYGLPDAKGLAAIKQATLQGWTQAQWENYLRAQPEYTASGEYKQNAIGLATALGFTPGATEQTVLGAGRPAPGALLALGSLNPAAAANPTGNINQTGFPNGTTTPETEAALAAISRQYGPASAAAAAPHLRAAALAVSSTFGAAPPNVNTARAAGVTPRSTLPPLIVQPPNPRAGQTARNVAAG